MIISTFILVCHVSQNLKINAHSSKHSKITNNIEDSNLDVISLFDTLLKQYTP